MSSRSHPLVLFGVAEGAVVAIDLAGEQVAEIVAHRCLVAYGLKALVDGLASVHEVADVIVVAGVAIKVVERCLHCVVDGDLLVHVARRCAIVHRPHGGVVRILPADGGRSDVGLGGNIIYVWASCRAGDCQRDERGVRRAVGAEVHRQLVVMRGEVY